MPEITMTLKQILDLDVLEEYDDTDGLFVYATFDNGFIPDERAEILWDDQVTRMETSQDCFGLQELATVQECIDMLDAFDNDAEAVIDFIDEEGIGEN